MRANTANTKYRPAGHGGWRLDADMSSLNEQGACKFADAGYRARTRKTSCRIPVKYLQTKFIIMSGRNQFEEDGPEDAAPMWWGAEVSHKSVPWVPPPLDARLHLSQATNFFLLSDFDSNRFWKPRTRQRVLPKGSASVGRSAHRRKLEAGGRPMSMRDFDAVSRLLMRLLETDPCRHARTLVGMHLRRCCQGGSRQCVTASF